MIRYIPLCIVLATCTLQAAAQTTEKTKAPDTSTRGLKEVIVTGTRTQKNLMQLPVPAAKIMRQDLKQRGLVRLDEVLAEQPGLNVISDAHGTGLQMQGLDPAYTLILIDGLPLIGRSTGILELSRVTTQNIQSIEIIKGPTSCLYGSDAMAGVVNIITEAPRLGVSGTINTRYGTNNNADLSVTAGYAHEKYSIQGFVNRNSSSGYTLLPESKYPTVSPFNALTANLKGSVKLKPRMTLSLTGRYYDSNQESQFGLNERTINGTGKEQESNISPALEFALLRNVKSVLQMYYTRYHTATNDVYSDDNAFYDSSFFTQQLTRGETQHDFTAAQGLRVTLGAGGQHETVRATRYEGTKIFNTGYGYAQADWQATKALNIIGGLRYDAHSVYKSQVSPKLAASYAVTPKITLLASAGRGYKAPDFRQLYLSFLNSQVGYSVYGYEEAAAGIAKLQAEGQIRSILIDPATLQKLNAESSMAYNAGVRVKPLNNTTVSVNFFRNNISNLINSAAIAVKTNGQSVYSYFNLNRVYTQGVEADANTAILKGLTLGGGLQVLQARDQDIMDKIKAKQVFTRDPATNETLVVREGDYGGLINRSKYSWNAYVNYTEPHTGINMNVRGIWRGRYGYRDTDGNSIVNRPDEYAKGYFLLNAAVGRAFFNKQLDLQLSAQNLLDYTQPLLLANMPGRLFYVSLAYNFYKR